MHKGCNWVGSHLGYIYLTSIIISLSCVVVIILKTQLTCNSLYCSLQQIFFHSYFIKLCSFFFNPVILGFNLRSKSSHILYLFHFMCFRCNLEKNLTWIQSGSNRVCKRQTKTNHDCSNTSQIHLFSHKLLNPRMM